MISFRKACLGLGASLALYATGVSAATTSFSPSGADGISFSWAVPEKVASDGSGNVYFRMEASDKWQWVGLGIGSGMVGADMFVFYHDGDGNVTLSTRKGAGHVMPKHVQRNDVTLLAGSGVQNGRMVANVRCSKCDDLSLSGSNSWISAWKSGDPLDSSNPSATITQHDGKTGFEVDFSKATINSDSNPFVGGANGNGGDTGPVGGGGNGDGTSGDDDSSGGAVTETGGGSDDDNLVLAHGIIMTTVFVGGYPIGGILMPLLGRWLIHASWQMIMFLAMWAGLGIGVWVARSEGEFFTQTHTRLGIFVVALLSVQPVLGYIHHRQYRKQQRRGVFSYLHVWYGRALMILGVINGGLGLQLASAPRSFTIAYSVLAGILGLLYAAFALFYGFKRRPASVKKEESVRNMSETETRDEA